MTLIIDKVDKQGGKGVKQSAKGTKQLKGGDGGLLCTQVRLPMYKVSTTWRWDLDKQTQTTWNEWSL